MNLGVGKTSILLNFFDQRYINICSCFYKKIFLRSKRKTFLGLVLFISKVSAIIFEFSYSFEISDTCLFLDRLSSKGFVRDTFFEILSGFLFYYFVTSKVSNPLRLTGSWQQEINKTFL